MLLQFDGFSAVRACDDSPGRAIPAYSRPAAVTQLGLNVGVGLDGSLLASEVVGKDVLLGFERELMTEVQGDDLIIRDLLVMDYPILLRLIDSPA